MNCQEKNRINFEAKKRIAKQSHWRRLDDEVTVIKVGRKPCLL